MRLLLTVFMALWVSTAQAQQANQPIRDVISQQLDAFRTGDDETAFSHASPSIRTLFGTTENFGRMVREGYPVVRRNSGVKFGALGTQEGRLVQKLFATDLQGDLYELQYEMIETDQGWKVNGVRVLQADATGV